MAIVLPVRASANVMGAVSVVCRPAPRSAVGSSEIAASAAVEIEPQGALSASLIGYTLTSAGDPAFAKPLTRRPASRVR
jgi:hypothetical protein